MNIWLIKIGETLPFDCKARKLRTAILSKKFIERGHSVLWWASAYDHLKKEWVFQKRGNGFIKEIIDIYIRKLEFMRFGKIEEVL